MASVPTKEMKLTEARAHFSEIVNEVHRDGTRVMVTKSGIPAGAIVSVQDLERLNRDDEARARDFAILDEIGEAFADVPWEEIEDQVDKAVAEVRAEMRTEREAMDHGNERRSVAEPKNLDYHAEDQVEEMVSPDRRDSEQSKRDIA